MRRRLIAPHRYQGEILFVVRIAAVDRLYRCCQSPLANALPDLAANKRIPILFFMLNQPTGVGDPAEAVGRERIVLGFPGVGGTRDGHIVIYAMIAQQPTTVGERDGRRTVRLRKIARAFRDAGLPTKMSRDIEAWLKVHAFFITAMCGAIYLAGGDCKKLSEDDAALRLMTKGVREGFAAVRALGLTVTPFSLRVLFTWLSDAFAVGYWRRFLAAEMADYVFGRHARVAAQEMREVARDCQCLLKRSGEAAPALLRLYRAIDAYVGEPARD